MPIKSGVGISKTAATVELVADAAGVEEEAESVIFESTTGFEAELSLADGVDALAPVSGFEVGTKATVAGAAVFLAG